MSFASNTKVRGDTLGGTFGDGTQLREAFSNQLVTVRNDQVRLTPSPNSDGLVLLEQADASASSAQFDYRNANIYFAMVDRFNNRIDPMTTAMAERKMANKR